MVETLIALVITLLIVGVVYWAVTQIIAIIPLPAPIAQIIHVLLILILVLVVIYALLPLLPGGGRSLLR